MRRRSSSLLVLVVAAGLAPAAFAQSTAFTFQGQLKDGAAPASGFYDLQFRVFDAQSGGTQVGTTTCVDNVLVTGGLVTTTVDAGQQFDSASPRYLEIQVRRDTGLNCANTSGFVALSPRQLLTGAPRADSANVANALAAPNGSNSHAAVVNNSGYVGIGTTAPTAPLQVVMPPSGAAAMRIQGLSSTAANTAFLSFGNSIGTDLGYVGDGSTGDNSIFLGAYTGDVGLITPGGRVLVAQADGSLRLGANSGDYRHFTIGGGNSEGYIYGSYPRFGDGIHMGYNYYADASGVDRVVHADGGTSRLTTAYGTISLATAPAFGGPPVDRLVVTPGGDVNVTGAIVMQPTVRIKTIHGMAFLPDNINVGTGSGNGFTNIDPGGATGYGFGHTFFAPLELPDGAVITGLCIDGIDERPTDMGVSIGRTSILDGTWANLAVVSTSGSQIGVVQHQCTGTVNSPVVNNGSYVYWLSAQMDSFGSARHRLIDARVQYTITQPLP